MGFAVGVSVGASVGVGDGVGVNFAMGLGTGVGLGAVTGVGSGVDFCAGFTKLAFSAGFDLGVVITGAGRVMKTDCKVIGITTSFGRLSDTLLWMAQISPACAVTTSSPIQTIRLTFVVRAASCWPVVRKVGFMVNG